MYISRVRTNMNVLYLLARNDNYWKSSVPIYSRRYGLKFLFGRISIPVCRDTVDESAQQYYIIAYTCRNHVIYYSETI